MTKPLDQLTNLEVILELTELISEAQSDAEILDTVANEIKSAYRLGYAAGVADTKERST